MAAFKLIPNPYIVGNPIKTTDMFYGRQGDFEFLKRKLGSSAESYVVVLCGERRSGKTSILFQVLNGRLGDHFMPVLIDMQTMAGLQNESEFFEKVASEIYKTLPGTEGLASKYVFSNLQNNPYQLFDKLIDDLNNKFPGKNLIFLVDEYELIDAKIEEGSLKINFIRYLAGLLESGRRVSFVMTGSEKLDQREGEHWNILFGKALYRNVSYLQESDTHRLITEPIKGAIKYPKEVLNKIYRLTAGQPFYTQVFCQNMVDYANEHQKNEIDVRDYHAVVKEILENPLPQMIYFWNSQHNNKKLILAMLAEVLEDENDVVHPDLLRKTSRKQEGEFGFHASLQSIIATLEGLFKEEVIKKEDGLYAFQIDLYRLWIKRDHSIWKVMKEVGKTMADDIRTTVQVSTSSKDSSSALLPPVKSGPPAWIWAILAVVVLGVAAYFLWPAGGESDVATEFQEDPSEFVEASDPSTNEQQNTDPIKTDPVVEKTDPPPTKIAEKKDPDPPKPDPAIGRANDARRKMLSAKRSAENDGATTMRSFASGRTSENTGASRQRRGDYAGAARSFAAAERDYRNARTEKQEQDQQRNAALTAQRSMKSAQQGVGNISRGEAEKTLQKAQEKAAQAEKSLSANNYVTARNQFNEARNLFAEAGSQAKPAEKQADLTKVKSLQAELQALKDGMAGANYSDLAEFQKAEEAENRSVQNITDGDIAAAEKALQESINRLRSAAATRLMQADQVRTTVDQYRNAMQQKSVASMKRQWIAFPDEMEKQWARVFRSVSDLQVDMNTQRIRFENGQAIADVDVRLNFSGASGGGTWNRWEMVMREAGNGWRIANINQSE